MTGNRRQWSVNLESGLLLPKRRGVCNLITTGPAFWGGSSGPPPTAYDLVVLSDNPVGFWPLLESSGTIASDISVNANNGSYLGTFSLASGPPLVLGYSASIELPGPDGAQFPGNNFGSVPFAGAGLVSVAMSPALDVPNNVSIECWGYVNKLPSDGYFFISGQQLSSGVGGYALYVQSSGRVGFGASASGLIGQSAASLTPGTVYFLAATLDNAGNWQILINGSVDASGTTGTSFSAKTFLTFGCLVGTSGGGVDYLNGGMSAVAVFSPALSNTRILSHYTAGS